MPLTFRITSQIVLALLAMTSLNGCSQGMTFYDVHGTMTLNGVPVEYAEMHIDPSSDDVNGGRTVHVKVVNGAYKARIPVAAGPATLNIAVVDVGTLNIKDPSNMTPVEDEKFLRAKKKTFEINIEIDRDEINIDL